MNTTTKNPVRPHSVYSPREEALNVYSHFAGALFSLLGTILLLISLEGHRESIWELTSALIYGLSMMALFSASTLYHSAKKPKWRYFCKLLDHCSIYLLIAGTYTPLVLLKFRLHDATQSWLLFTIIWLVAAVGIFYELYFHGKNKLISLGLYLIAGWTGIFFYRPLMMTLSPDAMLWLVAGGAFYTLGAVFYAVKKIPYNHALWHFFVLGGAFCHYVMTYQFIFPRS